MQAKAALTYRVQVLDRALAILDVLAARPAGCSLGEASAQVGLHKSTVHRLMMVLERHRLVDKSAESGRYRLGLKLFEYGSRAASATDVREHSRPYLNMLMRDTDETVHLCILDNGEVLYVEKMEPQRSVRMASSVGRRMPAHCTSVGKAMLALLPEEEVEALIRPLGMRALTKHTLTSMAALKAELRTTRTRGYAIDDEENEPGVRCIGAAVRDYTGRPVAAMSISAPAFRLTRDAMPGVAKLVMKAAAALSAELGYAPPRPARRN